MGTLNSVQLIGNLGADPELRYTSDKTAVCNLRIATTYRSKAGPSKTEWHRVVAWRADAENCAKYLRKGRAVYVQGRIETRTYEDKQKIKRYATEVVAERIVFLSEGGSPVNQQAIPMRPPAAPENDTEGPGDFDDDLAF